MHQDRNERRRCSCCVQDGIEMCLYFMKRKSLTPRVSRIPMCTQQKYINDVISDDGGSGGGIVGSSGGGGKSLRRKKRRPAAPPCGRGLFETMLSEVKHYTILCPHTHSRVDIIIINVRGAVLH